MPSLKRFKEDTKEVAKLIYKTYEKFCTKDASPAANKRYLSQYDTNNKSLK